MFALEFGSSFKMKSFSSTGKKPKKTKRPSREVKGDWPDNKIIKMINIIEQRPELWNVSSPEYKIPKPHVWQEVAAEIGSDDWMDCRAKWQNLRVSYKSNLYKLEKKRSIQGGEVVAKIHWRFFDLMSFLSKMDGQQATSSTSNFNFTDNSQYASQVKAEDEPPRFSEISAPVVPNVGKCRKRRVPSPIVSRPTHPSPTVSRPIHPSPTVPRPIQCIAEQMIDVGKQDDQHSATSSTSNLNFTDNSQYASQVKAEDEPPCFSEISAPVVPHVAKCRKRRVPSPIVSRPIHPSPTVSRPIHPSPTVPRPIQGIAEQMIDVGRQADQHSAFGDHIAAELRGLSTQKANVLKRRLTRVLIDFWEENENEEQFE